MRVLAFLVVLYSYTLCVTPVLAADEFGARFSAEAPAALEGDIEAALSKISPAAGDEENEKEAVEETRGDDQEDQHTLPEAPEE